MPYSPFASLLPAFLFAGKTLAWKCSACHKMFMAPQPSTELPPHIRTEFEVHSCYVRLRLNFPDVQKRAA